MVFILINWSEYVVVSMYDGGVVQRENLCGDNYSVWCIDLWIQYGGIMYSNNYSY